jgi:hypothetical protein
MTEQTNSMDTYANQILMDYLRADIWLHRQSHIDNKYIIEYNKRFDAIYTQGFVVTQETMDSIHVVDDGDDEKAYEQYEYYEEYYYQFIMDRTPPTWAEQMAHMVIIPSGPPEIADISSVYELMLSAPANEAAAAA